MDVKKLSIGFVGIFLMMVLFVACNKSDTTSSDTTNGAKQTLTIGFVGPLSGDPGYLGNYVRKGMDLAAEELRQSGMDIKIIYEDGKCNGKDAANAFIKLRDIDQVQAVMVGCSPEMLAVAPMAAPNNILVMSPMATAPTISDAGDHVFRVIPSDALQGKVGAELLQEKGYQRVGILYINHDYGVGLNKVVSSVLGNKVVASEAFDPDGKDFRTQLTKLKDKNADAIYLAAFPKNGQLILKQMKELGMTTDVLASEGIKDDMILPYAEGVLITMPMAEGQKYPEFKAKYVALYGENPGLYSGEAYDAVKIIAQAAKNNPSNIVEGMNQITQYDGAAGFITFDTKGDAVKGYDVFAVKNGQFVKVKTTN